MKLVTAGSSGVENVSDQQLREAFSNDARRGEFVILSQSPEIFIQAAGEDDGPYMLEHQAGGTDYHFSAGEDFRKDDVIRAFLWYLAGDARWETEFPWQKKVL